MAGITCGQDELHHVFWLATQLGKFFSAILTSCLVNGAYVFIIPHCLK